MSEIDTSCPHVLLGDFNAVRREDYSDPYWKSISDRRAMSRWESPQTELMNLLAPADNNGPLIDVGLHQKESQHQSSSLVHESNKEDDVDDEDEESDEDRPSFERRGGEEFRKLHSKEIEAVATCWVGTRIDYILISSWCYKPSDIVSYRIVKNNTTRSASDHFPVVADVHLPDL